MRRKSVCVFILFFVMLFGSNAKHSLATTVTPADSLTINPAYPEAYTNTSVSIGDLASLSTNSSIRWFVDGVEHTEAADQNTIAVTTKDYGEVMNVTARITSQTGNSEYRVSLEPVRVDVVVAANSYVPHFFRGRALPSSGSEVTATALVFGAGTGPFSYYWDINGSPYQAKAPRSAQQMSYKPGFDTETVLTVGVTDATGNTIAEKSLIVPIVKPQILFYESNPLHGLIPNVLSNPYTFLQDEMVIRGEPFYFSGNPSVFDIEWNIDRQTVAGDKNPLELSLKKTGDSGKANINLKIINTSDLLESAENDIDVNY